MSARAAASNHPQSSAFSAARAARIFTLGAAGVIGFQLALVGGAPWGALTQGGGSPGVLPTPGRAMAAVSAALLLGMAIIVRARAGLLTAPWAPRLARLVMLVCSLRVARSRAPTVPRGDA